MLIETAYHFSSASHANRFLNELKHWSLHDVKAKLFKQANEVKVSYEYARKEFDYTRSDLDDLARRYNGEEV